MPDPHSSAFSAHLSDLRGKSFAKAKVSTGKREKVISQNYFFNRLVWLATHCHLPISMIHVSVNRPK